MIYTVKLVTLTLVALVIPIRAADVQETTARERELLDRIQRLEARLAALEARQPPLVASPVPPAAESLQPQANATGDSRTLPGFASGTTLNFLLDGYYEYNFNRPADHINQLRAFDPTSNSFTLNQSVLMLERAPDVAAGRRYGMRLDLMFGQTTESLSGSPANELRTAPYRNIMQAYGTYVFPLGKGLTVDFGRFTSPIGFEGTYTKDQVNYSRSFLFTALPFYHMGFRSAYKFSDKASFTWLLVNGLNQMEDFNGFKSNYFMLSLSPAKSLTWNSGYYIGQESRDQPAGAISPNGRTHIGDTVLAWSATPKLTFVGEGDYIVNRQFPGSAPTHLTGGAGYVKYQLAPKFSLAGRFEYVSDRGGYLSGATQALKEMTATAAWQPLEGFQLRWEFRHDYSNQAYFTTSTPGQFKKEQSTALMGLLWWFGGKEGAW